MLKRALIIPDTHLPYHDKRAYKLMIKVAKELDPHEIVILGDYADFYSVSSHGKDPTILGLLIDEVESVNKHLDELDDLFPRAKKVYICGNHEHRLERYLCDKAPALFGITSIEHLFKLNLRPNWKFVPYGPRQNHKVLGSYLNARHEPLSSSAKATAAKALYSLLYFLYGC
jgi:predicted MPP superfamily phosphohydrolase